MISVIIPVRNAEKTIEQSILSVLSQEVADIEVLCIVNGTSDNTENIIRSISDDRVKILYSEPGIVPALNVGLRESRGDLVARQDADDVWLPNKLKKQLSYFDSHPEVDVLGTQLRIVNAAGLETGVTHYPLVHDKIVQSMLSGVNAIGHPSVLFKKRILDKCAGYLDTFPLAEDLDLWSRAILWYKFANLDENLVVYKNDPNPNYDPNVPKFLASWYRSLYGIKV